MVREILETDRHVFLGIFYRKLIFFSMNMFLVIDVTPLKLTGIC